MQVKSDFILREIAGESILIPTGAVARNFSGLIALNSSGRFLYDLLPSATSEEYLINAMVNAYDVDWDTAAVDVAEFLHLLRKHNILD